MAEDVTCGWWVGPVRKLDNEIVTCIEPPGHEMPHRAGDGGWFEGCGRPPRRADVCRWHPELGPQPVFPIFLRGRPEMAQEVVSCVGCLRESKPVDPPEFAS